MMRFYTQQHGFYAGIDLHAKSLSICVLNEAGEVVFAKKLPCDGPILIQAIAPFRKNLVVACECMFCWYWLADLCAEHKITFLIGHALYLKAIHGGKTKNDPLDAEKLARLLRGGNFPISYIYPKGMRETRDLLRRRTFMVRRRAEAMTHVRNTASQYNRPVIGNELIRQRDLARIVDHFEHPSVRQSILLDVQLLGHYDDLIAETESYLIRTTKIENPEIYARLRSIPGVGKILGLVMLYEIHDVRRFANVGDFMSYARLVRCLHESGGRIQGSGNNKIGNPHLRWAFAEAALLFISHNETGKKWVDRQARQRGSKGKALGILAARLGRAVYSMLRKQEDFDESRFWGRKRKDAKATETSSKKNRGPKSLVTS